ILMATYKVLSVCGSGTVTSSMVAGTLKETLKDEHNIDVTTTESRPTEAMQLAEGGDFDFIIHTSPLPKGDYGMPVINAAGLLTGFGEDEFFEEVLEVINNINK